MSCQTPTWCTPPDFAAQFPDLIGPTGPTGPAGSGTQGATGPQGPTGPVPYSAIRPDIRSWTDLANIATVGVSVPQIILWVDTDISPYVMRVTELRSSVDGTDTASGIQRPADFDSSTNQKVWFAL